MSNLEIAALAAAILIGCPILVFMCVKMGTYAYFRGKQQAQDDIQNERRNDAS